MEYEIQHLPDEVEAYLYAYGQIVEVRRSIVTDIGAYSVGPAAS